MHYVLVIHETQGFAIHASPSVKPPVDLIMVHFEKQEVAICLLDPYLIHLAFSIGILYEMQSVELRLLPPYLWHIALSMGNLYEMGGVAFSLVGSHLRYLALSICHIYEMHWSHFVFLLPT